MVEANVGKWEAGGVASYGGYYQQQINYGYPPRGGWGRPNPINPPQVYQQYVSFLPSFLIFLYWFLCDGLFFLLH